MMNVARLPLLFFFIILSINAFCVESQKGDPSEAPPPDQDVLLELQSPSLASLPQSQNPRIEKVFDLLKHKTLKNSYDLQAAQALANQKSAEYYTAWTRWFPHVDFQLSQTRTKDFSFLSSGTLGALANSLTPQTTTLKRWELGLTFPVYRRSIHLGLEQASSEKTLAQDKLKILETELNWKLRSLLGDYLLKIYKTFTLENSIRIAKTHLKDAELRFELGQRTKVDLLRSRSNLISLQSKKLGFQADQDTSLNHLLEYSGLTPSDLQEIELQKTVSTENSILRTLDDFTKIDHFLPSINPYLESPSLEKQMVNESPVYQKLITEEELNHRRAKSILAAEWPELLFRGTLNKQTPNWNETFSSGSQSYSMAVVLNIPLFSGGRTFSNAIETYNAQKANQLNTEKNILHFKNEIENDRIQIRSLLKSLEALKLSTAQNEEIVRLSFKSYQLGKATMVELLGSQNDLIDAKIALTKTKTELATLLRRFAWNLGVETP